MVPIYDLTAKHGDKNLSVTESFFYRNSPPGRCFLADTGAPLLCWRECFRQNRKLADIGDDGGLDKLVQRLFARLRLGAQNV